MFGNYNTIYIYTERCYENTARARREVILHKLLEDYFNLLKWDIVD